MNKYSYNGPVIENGRQVLSHWSASTYAVSESKARNNFIFRYKKENNLFKGTPVSLPGKIVNE